MKLTALRLKVVGEADDPDATMKLTALRLKG